MAIFSDDMIALSLKRWESVNTQTSLTLSSVPAALRRAAVLMPLLVKDRETHLLYIKRTKVLGDIHSGQVAFPGGAADSRDKSLVDTALREAHEEIGLFPEEVRVLGKLGIFPTISRYEVTPIVGKISWPVHLSPAAAEVDRVFTIPISWLSNPNNRETRVRQGFNGISHEVIYFKEYDGEVLWGASASFTVQLLLALRLIVQ